MKTFKHVTIGMLVAVAGICSTAAHAVTTTWTVNTLAAGVADTNVGDGICLTAAGECSLRAALEEANALTAVPGDDILIDMDPALVGEIVHDGGTPRMNDQTLGNTRINDYLGFGAYLHVNAQMPLRLDLDNRVGVVQHSDNEFAMLFIESDDVIVENFQNDAKRDLEGGGFDGTAGIMGGASSIVIGGARVTVRNGISADAGTDSMESCISLIDGASDILVEDFYCRGSAIFAMYVDEEATVSNIALNRFETQDGVRNGDIWINQGLSTDERTVVNGLTITDSEFRSSAIQHTIVARPNTTLNNLSITGSRFLAANVPGFIADPGARLGAVTVSNNTANGTGSFFGTDVNVEHTNVIAIRDNVLTGVSSDAIFLQSPTSGTRIEDNQFLNQATQGNVAGVRIAIGASGTNNIIADNLFDQDEPANRFAIWMRANPGVDTPTGWSIENNTIRNIFGSAFGPIYNDGDGNTLISGNTFGEGTRGAVLGDPAPENDDSFFVVNADGFSNGKIQTWRPTGAVFTGTTVRVAVAPVAELRAGNTDPTAPVSIDVYYTATDKAETYLGRIPGTHSSETVFEFTSTATSGGVRAQITDALGRSSQYSAAIEVVMAVDAGADDDMDGQPNGAECVINLLGIPLVCRDTDNDGTPDYLDTDDDNDGIPTRTECPDGAPCVDTDGDGDSNHLDLDSDADGITDAQECPELACRDTDGDGVANYIDVDSDGDGIEDELECPDGVPCLDTDENGIEDYLELPGTLDVRGTGAGAFGPWLLTLLGGLAVLRRRVALGGLLVLLMAPAAQAGDGAGWTSRFYGGAKVGALFTDFDKNGLTRALQAKGTNIDRISTDGDGVGYGLWVGYALSSHWGAELSYTTGADERASFSGAVGSDLQGALDVASPFLTGYGDTYLARLRYHHALSERWFLSPHVGVGVTQTRQTFRSRDREARLEDDTFTWAVGSGIQYVLSRDWSVGVAADYYQASSDNAYGIVSALVEWRFPRALPAAASSQPEPLAPTPTRVVPVSAELLNTVYFATDSDVLDEAARTQLDLMMPLLQGQSHIHISGHTDATGTEAHNTRLSKRRADAVVDYLTSAGLDPSVLNAEGYQAAQPAASNDDEDGRSRNRRAEIWLGMPQAQERN